MGGRRLVVSAGHVEEADSRPNGRQRPVELRLGIEVGVQVVDERREDALGIVRSHRGANEGGRVLGVVAVLPPEPFFGSFPLQRNGEKHVVAPGQKPAHVAVKGRDGGAELGLCKALSLPDASVPATFARHGSDAEPGKEALPEGEFIGQVERRRKPDRGSVGRFPPLRGAEEAPALPEEVKSGAVVVHEFLPLVVAAAKKAEGDLFPLNVGDGDLAAVVAEPADLRGGEFASGGGRAEALWATASAITSATPRRR